jgi:hypothetical protein
VRFKDSISRIGHAQISPSHAGLRCKLPGSGHIDLIVAELALPLDAATSRQGQTRSMLPESLRRQKTTPLTEKLKATEEEVSLLSEKVPRESVQVVVGCGGSG